MPKVSSCSCILKAQHTPSGALVPDLYHPPALLQAASASFLSNKLIWFQQIIIWLIFFFFFKLQFACFNKWEHNLASQQKRSQPNMTFTRPVLAPDFNIHYYSNQKNHRNYLFYCSLTHITQSCSKQNHRWTSGHTESTTTTLDMKRKFY